MKANKHRFYLLVLLIAAILLCSNLLYNNIINLQASSNPTSYLKDWEYIAIPQNEDASAAPVTYSENNYEWEKYDSNNPLFRGEAVQTVIIRTKLPDSSYKNPSLYFRGILADYAEIYINDKLQYKYNMEKKYLNDSFIDGFALPIQNAYQNEYLYVKLTSNTNLHLDKYQYVLIGEQRDILSVLVKKDLGKTIFGHFFIILFLCLALSSVFLKNFDKKLLYSLTIFTLLIGIMTLGRCINTVDLMYFYSPLFWFILPETATFLVPIPFVYFFENTFKKENSIIYNIIYLFHIIFFLAYLPIDIINFNNSTSSALNDILILTFCLFGLFDFLLISFLSIKASIKGNIEARIYIVGLGICILSLVYEIINHKGALHWGFFAFILCQVLILARRYYLRLEHYASELKEKNEALSTMNKNLEQLVAVRTASINNLLNNAGQGFLAFDKELKVFKEYSSECIVIFKDSIEGKNIAGLIAQEDKHQLEFLENVFTSIFNEKDADKKLLYLGLLPSEKLINGNNIRLEYKLTHDQNNDKETIMLILTDITEERYYEHKAENERNILKMVIKIVLNLHEFTECIREYQSFCSYGISEAINTSPTVKSVISEFYRSIHTFKGNLSIFNMINSVKKLHDIEEKIVGLSRSSKSHTKADIAQFISTLDLHKLLDEDMSIIEEVLGKKFTIQENNITISRYKLFEIEQLISEKLDEELCTELLPTIRKLRYKPFSELLKTYPDYAIKLSDRLQKPIYPFEIKGGEMQVDTDRYSDFARTLVHIFRNALDHGIEPMELRVGKGKTEYGNIECLIWFENGHIIISITDDGQGIDLSKVRYKAMEKGIYSDEELQSISDMELLNVIFEDEFSTRDTVNELSGRGVGLAAAKSEIERLNGRIEVYTEYDKGTEFRFLVPYYEETDFR